MCFDINLEDGKTGKTSSPGVISSGGMGPCIAIGIYDKKLEYGYMIHESNANHNQEVADFILDILKSSNKKSLNIWVAGGEINHLETDEINQLVQDDRDYVISILEKYFDSKQVTYHWNNSTDAIELILETESGNFYVEHTPMF